MKRGMTDKDIFKAELDRLKEETSIGLSEWENGVENGRMEIINALYKTLDSMQEEPVELKEVDLDKELESWRHNHFHGRRDKEASGEYLERVSQLDLAKHFFALGLKVAQKGEE